MYADDAVLRTFAEFAGIPDAVARQARDQFFPRTAIEQLR